MNDLIKEYRKTMAAEVLHLWAADAVADIVRLRAELEKVRGYEVAPLEAKVAELRAEADALRAVASAAKEVAAWFTSGNAVPVDGVQVMRIGLKSVYSDVHALNEALKSAAAMGADA